LPYRLASAGCPAGRYGLLKNSHRHSVAVLVGTARVIVTERPEPDVNCS